MKYLLIAISIFSLFIPDISASEYEGLVVKVTDGDSVKIKVGEITNTIRLLYIDAPEKKQDYGIKSKKFLENLLLNKRVFVVTAKDDRYGRQLADIYIYKNNEATYINAKMIKSGNAWVYRKYRTNGYLINLENHAKLNNKGLWGYKNPIGPCIFRKKCK